MMIREAAIIALMAARKIKTQRELARRCHCRPQTLSGYIKNRYRISNIAADRLCAALDCQPGDFLYYDAAAEESRR